MNKLEKDPIVLLVKFIRPKYVQDFKNGNLYFDSFDDIHKIESQTGISKWGDKNDGRRDKKVNINDPNFEIIISPEPNKHFIMNKASGVRGFNLTHDMNSEYYKNYGITCFFALRLSDFYFVPGRGFKIKVSVYNDMVKMQENTRKVFIIPDIGTFEHQLKTMDVVYGPVHYYDRNIPCSENVKHNPKLLAFQKENKFSYQKEYRIVKNLKNGSKITVPFLKRGIVGVGLIYFKRTFFHFSQLHAV